MLTYPELTELSDRLDGELPAELIAAIGPWTPALFDLRPLDERPAWSGRYAAGLTLACLSEHGTACHLCGLLGATTADHLIPRSRLGSDELSNLRPAHRSCNSRRQATPLVEWFASRPRSYVTSTPASREW